MGGKYVAHDLRYLGRMAKKTSLLKPRLQTRAQGEAAGPQRATQPAALCLMQLRAHVMRISMSKRRLQIAIENQADGEVPQPVKITHAG